VTVAKPLDLLQGPLDVLIVVTATAEEV